ncbi:hypothetical protein RRG08_048962 [Elysia crispata]|uniref:Uncharacterized protein n=1 Tax=Elysia crispata TaxID=231223 RepID=A0AAE1CWU5_9GAST|nr:hypothetical protein RRG08_048962 [Elysia crispata]
MTDASFVSEVACSAFFCCCKTPILLELVKQIPDVSSLVIKNSESFLTSSFTYSGQDKGLGVEIYQGNSGNPLATSASSPICPSGQKREAAL